VLLRDGKLVFQGTPAELDASPDQSVQAFLHPVIDVKNPRFRTKSK
jgi:hypothetical protein